MQEPSAIGLALNAGKTKLLTTIHLDTPLNVEVADGIMVVTFGDAVRKYSGRHIPGNSMQSCRFLLRGGSSSSPCHD